MKYLSYRKILTTIFFIVFSFSSGKPNSPGIYTRVGAYNSFILSTIDISKQAPYYSSAIDIDTYNGLLFSMIMFNYFLLKA
jgi:hypothetical protein